MAGGASMILKKGYRFSEKIVLHQYVRVELTTPERRLTGLRVFSLRRLLW